MKKLKQGLIIILFVLVFTISFAACSDTDSKTDNKGNLIELSAPANLIINYTTNTLTWSSVISASSYAVQINDDIVETKLMPAAYSIAGLAVGEYSLKVKANGDNKTYDDSDWSAAKRHSVGTAGLVYELINNDTEYSVSGGTTNTSATVFIPASYNDKAVTTIKTYAFSSFMELTKIIIPDSIKVIQGYAFSYCCGLTNIDLPNSLEQIGSWAFMSCSELTAITIPTSVWWIGTELFYSCDKLNTINVRGPQRTMNNAHSWWPGGCTVVWNYTGD